MGSESLMSLGEIIMKKFRLRSFFFYSAILFIPGYAMAEIDLKYVKDRQGIAIDFGASTGWNSIPMSEYFYHVVSVESDQESLRLFSENLKKARISNVTICNKRIAQTSEFVPGNPNSFLVGPTTFKQLLFDQIYSNDILKTRKISFINCCMVGSEENILEDLLHFAYNNGVKVCVSFLENKI